MEVKLIAATAIHDNVPGYIPEPEERWVRHADSDELAEMAGRLCYKSWDRPNPATSTNAGYLANILGHRHYSVLEHASATFYIGGVSRSLTHELVRHRHLSPSQVSQRYVDESEANFVVGEWFDQLGKPEQYSIENHMASALKLYQSIYDELTLRGVPKKAARGAARSVLPNMTETALVLTGNHRAWRDVIEKRNSPAADAEIRELAKELLVRLKEIAPNTYQDMEV